MKKAKKTKRNKRAKDSLFEVIDETPLPAIVDLMKKNTRCIAKRDGYDVYVNLVLDVTEIGGLSKKSKDEDVGQIIECINSGRIHTLAIDGLMAQNKLVFVPDSETLENMSEFGRLVDAPYTFAFVDGDDLIPSKTKIEFKVIKSLVDESGNINELLAHSGVDWADASVGSGNMSGFDTMGDTSPSVESGFNGGISNGSSPDKTNVIPPVAEVADDSAVFGDDDIDDVDIEGAKEALNKQQQGKQAKQEKLNETVPEVATEPAGPIEDDVEIDEENERERQAELDAQLDDEYDTSYSASDYAEDNGEEDDEDDDVEEVVITDEDMQKTLKSVFMPGSLDLEVSSEPFDAQFSAHNVFVPFDDNRNDGWLDNYVSQKIQTANAELKKMHEDNLIILRGKYMTAMEAYCNDVIVPNVDLESDDNFFGQMRLGLESQRDNLLNNIDKTVAIETKKLEDEYTAGLEKEKQEAVRSIEQDYRSRYERQLEHDKQILHDRIQNDIESSHSANMCELGNRRNNKARVLYEAGVAKCLTSCLEEYEVMLDEESKRRRQYWNGIDKYIDDNRKNDIAYQQMVDNQINHSTELQKAEQLYSKKYETLQKQSYDIEEKCKADIEKANKYNEQLVNNIKANYENQINSQTAELNDLKKKYNALSEQYRTVDTETQKKYDLELNMARKEADHWRLGYESSMRQSKRTILFIVILALLVIVAAVVCGLSIGSQIGMDNATSVMHQEINSELSGLLGS